MTRKGKKAPKTHPDAWVPEKALQQMREAVECGRCVVHPRVYEGLPQLGVPLAGLLTAIEIALEEITLENYKAPDKQWDPPGHGFVWYSKYFECRVYLKFRLEGRKPTCCLYSFHIADF